MNLRQLARGAPCYIRLPGICNGNPETTVLCHIRDGHTGGMGLKPPDTCAVPGCSACHDVCDGRAKSDLDSDFVLAEMSRGHRQWLKDLDRDGYRLLKVEPKRAAA